MSPPTVSAALDPAQGPPAAISSSSTIRHHERRLGLTTLRILGRDCAVVECRMLTGPLSPTGLVPLTIGRVQFAIDAFAATLMLPLGPCLRPRPALSRETPRSLQGPMRVPFSLFQLHPAIADRLRENGGVVRGRGVPMVPSDLFPT